MSGDLRAAEMRCADLVSELAARDDAAARLASEAAELRRLVGAMDADRDALQVGLGGGGGGRVGEACAMTRPGRQFSGYMSRS